MAISYVATVLPRCRGVATPVIVPEVTPRWCVAEISTPTGQALFGAAMADGRLSECLVTLAGSTVATLRRREAEG